MFKKIISTIRKKSQKKETEKKLKEEVPTENIDLNIFLPKEYQKDFYVEKLVDKETEWNLIVYEKEWNIPSKLNRKETVLNGFCRPVEVLDFPFRGKPFYHKIYRRKWKEKGKTKSYENQHELHPQGMKATREFGNFLKGLSGQEHREFFSAWPNLRYLPKEISQMV